MKRELKYGDKLIALIDNKEEGITKGDIYTLRCGHKPSDSYTAENDKTGRNYSFNSVSIGTVFDFVDARDVKPSLLMQAERVVNGDRNEQYGDPNIAFQEYADILSTTFDIHLTPEQICKVQMAIKLGRLKYKFKEDSLLDLMGYSEILNRLQK